MNSKRKILLIYQNCQIEIVNLIIDRLSHDFSVTKYLLTGDILTRQVLDHFLELTNSCQFGVAILANPESERNKKKSLIRRGSVFDLEIGIFLGYFSTQQVALCVIQDKNGNWPVVPIEDRAIMYKIPNQQSPLEEIRLSEPFDAICKDLIERFNAITLDVVPSILAHRRSIPSFKTIEMEEVRSLWGKFEGEFLCVNPSWRLETEQDEWLEVHNLRYKNEKFTRAVYVIDIDQGRATNDPANAHKRRVDNKRDLLGIRNFIEKFSRSDKTAFKLLDSKMEIYIRSGIRNSFTTFVGTLNGEERAFVFIRQLNMTEVTVLETTSRRVVRLLRNQINLLISDSDCIRPSHIERLCKQLIHKGSIK